MISVHINLQKLASILISGQQKVRPPDSYEITASHAACPLSVQRCIGLMQKPVKYSHKTGQTSKAIFTQNRPNIKSNTQMQTTSFLRSSITAKYSHKPQKHTHVLLTTPTHANTTAIFTHTKNTLASSATFTQNFQRIHSLDPACFFGLQNSIIIIS